MAAEKSKKSSSKSRGGKPAEENTRVKAEEQEITSSDYDGAAENPAGADAEEIPVSADAVQEPDDDDGETAQTEADPNQHLREMMARNFIEFASYVIKDRAIPDVDDGMKPVQRRIMWTLHINDNGLFHKVARISGAVMQFHPHGDASINEALVNLANKELFIDKQGAFGDIILGTPAAAARYIECRLGAMGRDVLFNDSITEMVDSYDGRDKEPVLLPAKIPVLLLMGANGVAVGTRTDIMPHNFNEVLQAQISILKNEPFALYPDFPHGGIMDVSEYEDGLGRIVLRAKVEKDGHSLIIREIPASTNTAKLTDSIAAAVEKSKIKVSKVNDYTAQNVNIQLQLLRGYDPDKALNALYTYTDCQMSVTCHPMVIVDNKPLEMSVSAILKRNTDRLVMYLSWELAIEAADCLDKILARTLARIFIEEKIYKRIEKAKTREVMFSEVRKGLDDFKDEWMPIVKKLFDAIKATPKIHEIPPAEQERLEQLSNGVIPDKEIAVLVEIPIRRIAAFEVDKNREEIELLEKTLAKAVSNLKSIKKYTIKYLEGLIEKYGAAFPRRTEICLEGFARINKQAAALNNIRVGWDRKNCYIGTDVKSEDVIVCNEFDHLLCVERTGEYKIIDIPEKIFIDRLKEFRKYDKTTQFGIVYSEKKTGKVYFKRTSIGSFIKDREYRIVPEHCTIEVITPRPDAIYEIRVDTPIRAKQVQTINLMDAPVRSPRAGGSPISARKLLKITFVRYLDETDAPANSEGELLPAPEAEDAVSKETPSAPEVKAEEPVKAKAPVQEAEEEEPVKAKAPVQEAEEKETEEIEKAEEKVMPSPKPQKGRAAKTSEIEKVVEEESAVPEIKAETKKTGAKKQTVRTPAPKPAPVKEEKLTPPKPAPVKEAKPAPKPAPAKEAKPEPKPAPKPAPVKEEKPEPKSAPKAEKPVAKGKDKKASSDDDDESWGISQPDLGF